MKRTEERKSLERLVQGIRRDFFVRSYLRSLMATAVLVLPCLLLAVAADQRWNQGSLSWWFLAAAVVLMAVIPLIVASLGLGHSIRSALIFDQEAQLKDRVSSALEFLSEDRELDSVQQVQIRDAIERARAINRDEVFRFRFPRYAPVLPLLGVGLILSFFVPPVQRPAPAAPDDGFVAQVETLKELEREIASQDLPKELEDVLKKLQTLRESFEKGELTERDVLLELARLDEALRNATVESGSEQLQNELNTILPHLMSASAARQFASALKEDKIEKAMEELEKLSDKARAGQLSEEEKRELALKMGLAAAKLGSKSSSAFAGDFASASEALKNSDKEGFCSACNSIGKKLGSMKRAQSLAAACNKIGLCKSGFCQSKEQGFTMGPKTQSDKKGGLKAGTGASGSPLGERTQLEAGLRKVLQVAGQAGEGPVETEIEVTEGQLSPSRIDLKEFQSAYAAVAEEAMERESVPLSRRYHVKRYFQAIRPQE